MEYNPNLRCAEMITCQPQKTLGPNWRYNNPSDRKEMTNLINQTLRRLETHLQALIEGSTERFFPVFKYRNDLGRRLVEAMQTEIRPAPDGTLFAPNLFTIFLPEEQAQVFQNQQELLDELADCLRLACQDTQVLFASEPVVKVISNPEPGTTETQIVAQFNLELEEKTSTLVPQPASNPEDQALRAFLIVDGTQVFPLDGKLVRIGQSEENELVIDHPQVSPVHAQLRLVRGRYTIFDLSSEGGTFVNGTKVSQHLLAPGDVISLGGLPLVFGIDHTVDLDRTQELSLAS